MGVAVELKINVFTRLTECVHTGSMGQLLEQMAWIPSESADSSWEYSLKDKKAGRDSHPITSVANAIARRVNRGNKPGAFGDLDWTMANNYACLALPRLAL
ncbi:hypothetical protein AXG93_4601s1320 [Marchantia polymorpha subsp. ruderalis]|uniref:Uncharacterized protein n=1 Tax=Marchantia polymorpha subsp. ruderalis TaxID=1480154 RepID=A0A176W062_MARPO|nr:hypothetical protein AXG93_4601s1320 [Marchantia polymorpha subsp. ruderalis]